MDTSSYSDAKHKTNHCDRALPWSRTSVVALSDAACDVVVNDATFGALPMHAIFHVSKERLVKRQMKYRWNKLTPLVARCKYNGVWTCKDRQLCPRARRFRRIRRSRHIVIRYRGDKRCWTSVDNPVVRSPHHREFLRIQPRFYREEKRPRRERGKRLKSRTRFLVFI